MDPFIGGSLISAGSSLLGGLFGRKKKGPSAFENTMGGIKGQAEGSRKHGEKYGFNPLTLLGVSAAMGPSAAESNTMGTAIANAGMMFADGLARSHEAKQVSALERQNQELQKQVEEMTLRPKVGGIYARQETTPTLLSALGKGSVHAVAAQSDTSAVGDKGGYSSRAYLDAVKPEGRNTFEAVQNDGETTYVPIGPDIDEIISGIFISANNRDKARRKERARTDMTFGDPVSLPTSVFGGRGRALLPRNSYPDQPQLLDPGHLWGFGS